MSRAYKAQLLPAAQFPAGVTPALRAPICLPTAVGDASTAVTPGWYLLSVVGAPVTFSINAATNVTTTLTPQYPIGYCPIPIFIGIPGVPGGTAPAAIALHYQATTATAGSTFTLTPLDSVGAP
jgi:hypothetical protein